MHGHNKQQKTNFFPASATCYGRKKISKYLATSFIGRRCKSDEQPTASVLLLSRVDHVTKLSENLN